MRRRSLGLPLACAGFAQPVSLLAPVCNEAASISAAVHALLRLDYPEFEIIVINDGSKDGTMEELVRQFALFPLPEVYQPRLPCREVRGVYHSTRHDNLRVIDKLNGGRADALNAGINVARHPLYCTVNSGAILQRDALTRMVQPFLEDPRTIVTGSAIRVANGSKLDNGLLLEAGLPGKLLARFQIVETLRAFLFGRLGWSPLNAVLLDSRAFGLLNKNAVIDAGGYHTDSVGADMELILRLHKINRLRGTPYRITFIPAQVCWAEASEDLRQLRNRHIRWQRGFVESLAMNRQLLFHPRAGMVGWLVFPLLICFEVLGPLFEAAGYAALLAGLILGALSWQIFATFMLVALNFGILLSVTALLLEESYLRLYPKPAQSVWLLTSAVLENFGYRQLVSWWRLQGLLRWSIGGK
ncbi:MAG: glycosyltransferase [Betaproteobacteria bacterium]|nr:glycosyltransferase [Betaproteobacteria bacterium]